jgi:hypothetical protein
MAGLCEAVDQITQPIAQQITDAPSGQRCTKISWKAAAWTGVRPSRGRVHLTLRVVQPFRDLVTVLIARDGE